MNRRRRPHLALALILLACGASACDYSRERLAAKRAAQDFHAAYDRSRFGAMYAGTDLGFRKDETASRFVKRIAAQHDSLGGVVNAELAGAVVERDEKPGLLVKQEYRTRFERGTAVEQLTWRVKAPELEARLLSYRIR
jgi:opacity protein-like surface antigen